MPAGNYAALRITIGAGEGQNWWCVMFPPLCLPAVTSRQELPAAEPYFSPEVSEILESGGGRIEVRFKLLEWWRRVFG
jgi:stage II sporulation protein R